MTRQQEARVLIGDRERIAIDPIAGAEVAFEVGRPEIIRLRRDRRHDPRMLLFRLRSWPTCPSTRAGLGGERRSLSPAGGHGLAEALDFGRPGA